MSSPLSTRLLGGSCAWDLGWFTIYEMIVEKKEEEAWDNYIRNSFPVEIMQWVQLSQILLENSFYYILVAAK